VAGALRPDVREVVSAQYSGQVLRHDRRHRDVSPRLGVLGDEHITGAERKPAHLVRRRRRCHEVEVGRGSLVVVDIRVVTETDGLLAP